MTSEPNHDQARPAGIGCNQCHSLYDEVCRLKQELGVKDLLLFEVQAAFYDTIREWAKEVGQKIESGECSLDSILKTSNHIPTV